MRRLILLLSIWMFFHKPTYEQCTEITESVDCFDWCPVYKHYCHIGAIQNNCRKSCERYLTEAPACLQRRCEQVCTSSNNGSTAYCSCRDGYYLSADGRTCIVQSCRAPYIPSKPVSFRYACSNLAGPYVINSWCVAYCSSSYVLVGTRMIRCEADNLGGEPRWSGSFLDTQCIPKSPQCSKGTNFCSPAPCNVESCPGVLNSHCINNVCGKCTAEFYENGKTFNKKICQIRECPSHLPQAKCVGNLCEMESCPSYPDAICVVSGCGGCEAVFYNRETGEVIPKFACPLNVNFPACLNSLDCLQIPFRKLTGCLGFPGAIASQPCTCGLTFTDPRTGRILSDKECEFECPNGLSIAFCNQRPCDSATCPMYPGAICTDNFCGGCTAVFTDSKGAVLNCTSHQ